MRGTGLDGAEAFAPGMNDMASAAMASTLTATTADRANRPEQARNTNDRAPSVTRDDPTYFPPENTPPSRLVGFEIRRARWSRTPATQYPRYPGVTCGRDVPKRASLLGPTPEEIEELCL